LGPVQIVYSALVVHGFDPHRIVADEFARGSSPFFAGGANVEKVVFDGGPFDFHAFFREAVAVHENTVRDGFFVDDAKDDAGTIVKRVEVVVKVGEVREFHATTAFVELGFDLEFVSPGDGVDRSVGVTGEGSFAEVSTPGRVGWGFARGFIKVRDDDEGELSGSRIVFVIILFVRVTTVCNFLLDSGWR